MDVVVWALWIWIACSAVALVFYVVRRVQHNRRQRAAILHDGPLPANPALAKVTSSSPPAKKRSMTAKGITPAAAGDAPRILLGDESASSEAATPTTDDSAPKIESTTPKAENDAKPSSGMFSSLLAPRVDDTAIDDTAIDDTAIDDTAVDDPNDTIDVDAIDQNSAEHTDLDEPSAADEQPSAVEQTAAAPAVEQTLADLLSGVRLPCDLLPVDGLDPEIADVAVTLVTMTAAPETVGVMLADELERLGYEIFSLSDAEAVAKRGTSTNGGPADLLSLVIRTNVGPNGQSNEEVDESEVDRELPSAVAVDLWVGGDESPLAKSRRSVAEA